MADPKGRNTMYYSSNKTTPVAPINYTPQLNSLQEQMANLNTFLSNGNVIVGGDDGYAQVRGGVNKYGISRPDYTLLRDPTTGQLHQNFQQTLGTSYGALRDKALTEGDSKWAQLQKQLNATQTQQGMDDAAVQNSTAMANARTQLAMKGGLRSGANERISSLGANNLMAQQQQLGRQSSLNNLNIGTQDEQMKNTLLGQVGTQEQAVQSGNINRLAADIHNQNLQRYGIYREDMQAYGAQQSANAQASAASGGGGGMCFITTACCELFGLPDDNNILNTFRRFRDEKLGGKEAVKEYYEVAPKILAKMEEKGEKVYLYKVFGDYLIPAFANLQNGNEEYAYEIYKNMVEHLKNKYLNEEGV